MNGERLRAQVTLEEDQIRVEAEQLADNRLELYFRAILGCELVNGAWICPLRRRSGNDLIVQIATQLRSRGYEVTASGGPADRALQREVDRLRSFERADRAARDFLGLNTSEERVAMIDEAQTLASLEDSGWNNAERALLPHQRESMMHALTAANAANFSVPGAGKTATALAVAVIHLAQNVVDAVLVIGPLSCFRPWEREADIALPGVFKVQRVRGMQRAARAHLYSGVDRGNLLLLSYATAAHDRAELEKLCDRLNVMLVVDESHRVKRFRGGEWAPALVEVASHAKVRMILTGTPMPQGPTDLWSQFNILWPGEEATSSRGAFQAMVDGGFATAISRLEPFFTRTPKAALELEEADFYTPSVALAPLQADIYRLVFNQLRSTIPSDASMAEKIERLRRARPIRLIQAASNPDLLNESDGYFNIPPIEEPSGTLMERLERYRHQGELPAKFEWALDYLAGLRDDQEKCVVWTTFIRNIDQFAALIEDRLGGPVFTVDGRIPAAETIDPELNETVEDDDYTGEEIDETREQRIDQFLGSEGFAVLIANPAACAESISLHRECHRALYLDRTHDCARWLQSIDRIHRLGLPEGVRVEVQTPIAALDGGMTIDGLIETSLLRKESRMQELLNAAELRAVGLGDQDTIEAAEGEDADLEALLRYLLGEEQ
ncbi:MAG: DEAD/DEAH box helicase [Solirubrobacterales bacterium]